MTVLRLIGVALPEKTRPSRRLPKQSNVGWRSDAASPGEPDAGSSQCVGLEPGRKVITSPREAFKV